MFYSTWSFRSRLSIYFLVLCALLLNPEAVFGEEIVMNGGRNAVRVLSANEGETILELTIGCFQRSPISIGAETYYRLRLQDESVTFEKGTPELPRVVRSIIIPDRGRVEVQVLESEHQDFRMAVAPAKGLLSYGQDAANVPWEFQEAYGGDQFYPFSVAALSRPYVLRDFRAVTLTIFPFAYSPQTNTVRVYSFLRLRIHGAGEDNCDMGAGEDARDLSVSTPQVENAKLRARGDGSPKMSAWADGNPKLRASAGGNPQMPASAGGNPKLRARGACSGEFLPIYKRRFLNFPQYRYDPIDERGRMVVICHGDFLGAIQPYVDWKRQKGIPTDLWDVAAIGDTPQEIKDFIQDQYESGDLTFVQLVGDETYVPTFITEDYFGWDIYGRSDSRYALMEGQDLYPEIFVGRFSCESVADLETQVHRTIHYERDLADGEWLHRGAGLGTVWGEGYGYNGWNGVQSLEVIRGDLLGYHYTEVAQLYEEGEPPFGIIPVEAWEVTEVLHDGIGILNVDGNADLYYLDTGSYAIGHVHTLENDYELPFIFLAAPWCGNFSYDCFAEAWLRATNGATGAPTGAIAVYTSSNALQYAPPQAAMHETVDLLVGDEKNSFGGLMYNGACFMMDLYGAPDEYDTFSNFNILGDVALQVRTNTPEPMEIAHEPTILQGQTEFLVSTGVADALVCLSLEAQIVAGGYTDGEGNVTLIFDPFWEEIDLTLTVTAYNKITSVEVVPVTGDQAVSEGGVPKGAIAGIHPNPASGDLAIHYSLGSSAATALEIWSADGRKIRTLVAGAESAGAHIVTWDGCNDLGRLVPSGVYFVRLTTEGVRTTREVRLIR